MIGTSAVSLNLPPGGSWLFLFERQVPNHEPKSFHRKAAGSAGRAQSAAVSAHHQAVDVEHLASALLEDDEGLASSILKLAGADVRRFAQALADELRKIPEQSPAAAPMPARPTSRSG